MIDFENASFIKLRKTKTIEDVQPLMVSGEEIIGCYKGIRDYVVFTNKRIISVNVQGLTGKKKDFTTLPYSKVQVFSIETAGVIDIDSELELWFSGGIGRVRFEFSGSNQIIDIGNCIASYAL